MTERAQRSNCAGVDRQLAKLRFFRGLPVASLIWEIGWLTEYRRRNDENENQCQQSRDALRRGDRNRSRRLWYHYWGDDAVGFAGFLRRWAPATSTCGVTSVVSEGAGHLRILQFPARK